jgi:hypothetical protein
VNTRSIGPVIFVSRPSVLAAGQEMICRKWLRGLSARGLQIEQLRRPGYEGDPWEQLRRFFDRADGVLVLGMRQLVIDSGVWRTDTVEEASQTSTWTSPWMQVEAAMAIANGIPVLVAPEIGVCEGVFAKENWLGSLYGTPVEDAHSPVVDLWVSAVVANPCSARRQAS